MPAIANRSRKKLLVFWCSADFEEIYKSSFENHPDFDIELVSWKGRRHERAGYRRLLRLRHEVDKGKFDAVVSNNIMRSPFPGNKGWATTASLALRYLTWQRRRLDTWWAPWVVRGGRSRTPLAVIDARDSIYIYPWDLPLLEACTLYFKKDLMNWPRRTLLPLADYYRDKRVLPLQPKLRPMSQGLDESRFAASARPMKERDIDLFMSGNPSIPLRAEIIARCEKLAGRFRVFVNRGLLPAEEYRAMLQRTKLAVCVESYGGETWRQYEVAAAGAVPLMSWPFTQLLDPLVPDEHAFYFSFIGDHFERTIETALRDDARLQRMSEAARAFVLAKKHRSALLNHVVNRTIEAAAARQS
jgi:hypothetical protein